MGDRKILSEAMLKYLETRDGDLITEEVYFQLTKLARYVCRSFVINYSLYRDTDELMSAINIHLWDKIYDFNPDKSSITTYISLLMYTAVLMDIRKNRKYDGIVSLSDSVFSYNDARQEDSINFEDVLMDNRSLLYIDVMIIDESSKPIIKEAIEYLKIRHKRSAAYAMIDEILKLRRLGLTITEISKICNISRTQVTRILNNAKKEIYSRLKSKEII